MKKIIQCIILLCISFFSYSQYVFVEPFFQPSLNCHVNVNERPDQDFRNDLKRAVFRLTVPGIDFGTCSAVLINRNTGQNNLGQYFITAWHCFKSGDGCGGYEFNFNDPVSLMFNYQSPNNESLVFSQNQTGNQYQISRQIRLVDKFVCAYGDFALCEILGPPVPPHFNPYYAGWYPNALLINNNGQFATIHHPSTIKKISGVNSVSGTSGSYVTCHTITTIIDFLFGWIWGRRWSTQVICTYTQIPGLAKFKVAGYQFGKIEDGSSGGGLFTGNSGNAGANRLIGQLSAKFPEHSCSWIDPGISYYGKFTDSYHRQTVKNTLNPPNKFGIDQGGIPGRQITCYPQLNINAEGNGFNLYPANLYQQQNEITLTSQSTINTSGNINVMTASQFNFVANQSITFNPGFEVQPGAVFNASLSGSPCFINNNTYRQSEEENNSSEYETPDMNEVLKNIPIPEQKEFNLNKHIAATEIKYNNITKLNVFPNPSSGVINIAAFFKEKEKRAVVEIFDINGKKIFKKEYSGIYLIYERMIVPTITNGIYNVIINTSNENISKRIVVMR